MLDGKNEIYPKVGQKCDLHYDCLICLLTYCIVVVVQASYHAEKCS